LQYFIGLAGFQDRRPPFHHSLMTHFRKRLNAEVLQEINEWIAVESAKQEENGNDDDSTPSTGNTSKRKQPARPSSSSASFRITSPVGKTTISKYKYKGSANNNSSIG
jgi:hypothetical protein